MTALTKEEHAYLTAVPLEDISDACDKLSIAGGFIEGIKPLWPVGRRIVGPIMTVELVGVGYPPSSESHLGSGAIDAAEPGQVIVVDHKGRTDCAGWGGLLSQGAAVKGLAATVVFGAIRDVDEAREIDFPVFGLASTPVSARGRAVERGFGQAIQCARVTVRPGDIAVISEGGCFVLPSDAVGRVIEAAAEIQAKQDRMSQRIREGTAVSEVMGQGYERMLTRS